MTSACGRTASGIAPRAIRCVLHTSSNDQYEKNILTETYFLFKKLTDQQYLKCVLVGPLAKASVENKKDISINESEDQTWVVKLYKPVEYRKLLENGSLLEMEEPTSINDLIIESNYKEHKKSELENVDIRVRAGEVEVSYNVVKTGLVEEQSKITDSGIIVKEGQVEASYNASTEHQSKITDSRILTNKRKIEQTLSMVSFCFSSCLV